MAFNGRLFCMLPLVKCRADIWYIKPKPPQDKQNGHNRHQVWLNLPDSLPHPDVDERTKE